MASPVRCGASLWPRAHFRVFVALTSRVRCPAPTSGCAAMETGGPPLAPSALGHRFGQIPLPNPRSGGGGGAHRRAISESFLSLPDDLLFDTDPDFGVSDLDFPSLSDDNVSGGCEAGSSGALLAEHGATDHSAAPSTRPIPGAHLRSLSVDTALFEGLGFQAGGSYDYERAQERKGHHRRSGSVDGSISSFEGDSASLLSDYAKKAMPADKLAELALLDPRRAKRHHLFLLFPFASFIPYNNSTSSLPITSDLIFRFDRWLFSVSLLHIRFVRLFSFDYPSFPSLFSAIFGPSLFGCSQMWILPLF